MSWMPVQQMETMAVPMLNSLLDSLWRRPNQASTAPSPAYLRVVGQIVRWQLACTKAVAVHSAKLLLHLVQPASAQPQRPRGARHEGRRHKGPRREGPRLTRRDAPCGGALQLYSGGMEEEEEGEEEEEEEEHGERYVTGYCEDVDTSLRESVSASSYGEAESSDGDIDSEVCKERRWKERSRPCRWKLRTLVCRMARSTLRRCNSYLPSPLLAISQRFLPLDTSPRSRLGGPRASSTPRKDAMGTKGHYATRTGVPTGSLVDIGGGETGLEWRGALRQRLVRAKRQSGLTYSEIGRHCGISSIQCAQIFRQEARLARPTARLLRRIVPAISEDDVALLFQPPTRSYQDHIAREPLVHSVQELIRQNAGSLKAVIHEELGDGLLSPVDCQMSVDRVRDVTGGDRLVITMEGKYLPYEDRPHTLCAAPSTRRQPKTGDVSLRGDARATLWSFRSLPFLSLTR